MKQRPLGKTGLSVTEVGLGCEHLMGKTPELVHQVVNAALDAGVNTLELFMSDPEARTNIGQAIKGRREGLVLEGHIGAVWTDGQYERSRDLETCKHFVEDWLTRYQTDHMEIGMVHFIDDADDMETALKNGIFDYAHRLKAEGVVKAVGLSSHNPAVAQKAVEDGLIDVLLFSVNPAYDLMPSVDLGCLFSPETFRREGLLGMNPERSALYNACLERGVGITVMKGLGAGLLMNPHFSPFGQPLTVHQLIRYALDRPAVASVMVGCQTLAEVAEAVAFDTASEADTDYSALLSSAKVYEGKHQCMYCNHCHPCPARIDVAAVNKYLDLALAQAEVPATVKQHYLALSAHGSDCLGCGACEGRCPFHVPVIERMQKAAEVFGK